MEDVWSVAVANHGVAEDLIEQTFEENRKFFALPEASKREILADENNRCNFLASGMFNHFFLSVKHSTRVCYIRRPPKTSSMP